MRISEKHPVRWLSAPLAERLCFSILTVFLLAVPAWSQQEQAQEPGQPLKSITFYWENDVFTGTDREYTNGLKLTLSQPLASKDEDPSRWAGWYRAIAGRLPFFRDEGVFLGRSFSIGQSIYTPEDTDRSELIEDDRPYAGYLYLGFSLHALNRYRRDTWELDVGVVGPSSLGEALQNAIHRANGSSLAQGWDHQLNDEPTLEIIYETKYRIWHHEMPDGFGFDFIPHIGARAGNVAVYANTGFQVRVGWYVPQNFGSCPIRPGCDFTSAAGDYPLVSGSGNSFGIHFFTGAEGRVVLHDIFLDGNTFTDSHSVDRKLLVADLMAGISAGYKRWSLSYAYVLRTRQFDEQDENQLFGAFNVSYAY